MKIISYLLQLFVLLQVNTLFAADFGFSNPVLPGMNPDPSVCRAGDDYYLVTSSFVQYPGLPVYHSNDLIHWEMIGYCCREENGFDVSCGSGLYAPTIRYNEKDSTFYVICTNMRNGGNFITYTKNPRGIWSKMVYLSHKEMHGIDPSLLFDNDGKCYYTATHVDGIIQAEIDPSTGKNLTEPKLIWGGTGGRYPEGPHLYHIGSWYYLIISEGGTEYGHHVVASRSNNPWGPFEICPYNPILSHVEKIAQSNPIQCTGHSDILQAHDGSWWAVFLAARPVRGGYHLGRETFLTPVIWTRDYWPVFNGNGVVDLDMCVKTLPQTEGKSRSKVYDFNTEFMPLEWNYYRHPKKENFILNDGKLLIKSDNKNASFVGVRQCDFEMIAETCLQFSPEYNESEAGLSVRHGTGQHYDIGVRKENNQLYLITRFKFSRVNQIEKYPLQKTDKVYLRLVADKEKYTFQYSFDGITWEGKDAMDANFLAGGFSGLLVGLYAENMKASEKYAEFDYFKYESMDK